MAMVSERLASDGIPRPAGEAAPRSIAEGAPPEEATAIDLPDLPLPDNGCSVPGETSWEQAVADLQVVDAGAVVHGSRATGLAHADSDVDVLTSLSLEALLQGLGLLSPRAVRKKSRHKCGGGRDAPISEDRPLADDSMQQRREEGHGGSSGSGAGDGERTPTVRPLQQRFEVLEHVKWTRVPRLILRHSQSGTKVDVICTASDPQAQERDAIVRAILAGDPRARGLAELIGAWVRPRGALLPPLAATGPDLLHWGDGAPAGVGDSGRDGAISAQDLFREWLLRLADSETGLWADLRSPWEAGVGWRVVDPVSGQNLIRFKGEQPAAIAALARRGVSELEEEALREA
mmetsp:Transcript_91893/g.259564  ORF Transcript_91893/g.259564 Transcript_91893/m.259564 type:complete len:347 (-) Transcript_91893:70-1110(-)